MNANALGSVGASFAPSLCTAAYVKLPSCSKRTNDPTSNHSPCQNPTANEPSPIPSSTTTNTTLTPPPIINASTAPERQSALLLCSPSHCALHYQPPLRPAPISPITCTPALTVTHSQVTNEPNTRNPPEAQGVQVAVHPALMQRAPEGMASLWQRGG